MDKLASTRPQQNAEIRKPLYISRNILYTIIYEVKRNQQKSF